MLACKALLWGGLHARICKNNIPVKGAKELSDLLERRRGEVEGVISQVKGFVSYTLARSGDGGFSATICQDKAGADESVRVARDWIAKNAGNTGAAAPRVSEGSVIIHLDRH